MNRINATVQLLKCVERASVERRRMKAEAVTACLGHVDIWVREHRERNRERHRRTAPDFNLFRVLRLSRSEVRAHTPMLAHLLDAEATHGQGALFLDGFLDLMRSHGAAIPISDGCRWYIDTDRYTAEGILDVVLECPTRRTLIVIENKVDAAEQPEQMARYGAWLDKQKFRYSVRHLVFLTPSGARPLTAGTCDCLQLSYRSDIRPWLLAARTQVHAPNVITALEQYLAVLDQL